MAADWKENQALYLGSVGLASWLLPGGGYMLIGEVRRGLVILAGIAGLFLLGLWVGSIGVIDPIGSRPWYLGQIFASPAVFFIGLATKGGMYPVFGKPEELGQIMTVIAGLLNLLVIVNSVYYAHVTGEENK